MRATPWPRAANRGHFILPHGTRHPSFGRCTQQATDIILPEQHSPFAPAEAGAQTWRRSSAYRVEDARERAYGPWVPAFATRKRGRTEKGELERGQAIANDKTK